MAQFAVPTSDQATGSWGNTPLWSKVEEGVAGADGTTIASDNNTSPDNADFKLTSLSAPGAGDHILRAKWNKDASGGHSINAVWELWQGVPGVGSLIATLSVIGIGNTPVTSAYTLSGAEVGNISDPTDLYGRLSRQGDTGGNPGGRRALVVDAVEFETPDAGGQTVAIGLASETDSALALTGAKAKAISLASEADTAFGLTRAKAKAIALATETMTAFGLAFAKNKGIGQASETDTALPLVTDSGQTIAIGQAQETTTAQPLSHARAKGVGLAQETDTAQPMGRAKSLGIVQALEADTSLVLSFAKAKGLSLATEIDTAFKPTSSRAKAVGLATEADTAFAVTFSKAKGIGLAIETDTALALQGQAEPPPPASTKGQCLNMNMAMGLDI